MQNWLWEVSKDICMKLILEKFPDFQAYWEKYKQWWEGQESGLCNDMSEFSHYVSDLLAKNNVNPFVPYLGQESREYCKAWDQFTGVRTEGLW